MQNLVKISSHTTETLLNCKSGSIDLFDQKVTMVVLQKETN